MGRSGHADAVIAAKSIVIPAKAGSQPRRRRASFTCVPVSTGMTSFISFPPEYGLALFHERAPPFGVVLALEAVEDEAPGELEVRVLVLQHLADDRLAGPD